MSILKQISLHDEILHELTEKWKVSSGKEKEGYRKKIDKALDLRSELMKIRDDPESS